MGMFLPFVRKNNLNGCKTLENSHKGFVVCITIWILRENLVSEETHPVNGHRVDSYKQKMVLLLLIPKT